MLAIYICMCIILYVHIYIYVVCREHVPFYMHLACVELFHVISLGRVKRSPSLLGGVKTGSLGPLGGWLVGWVIDARLWLGLASCQYYIIWYVRSYMASTPLMVRTSCIYQSWSIHPHWSAP